MYPILYVYYETGSLTTNTHTPSLRKRRKDLLSCSVQPHLSLSSRLLLIIVGTFYSSSIFTWDKSAVWWLKNTRPAMAPPISPFCKAQQKSDALSTNTRLCFGSQHDSMFFFWILIYCMIAEYVLNIWEKSMLLLFGNPSFSCKSDLLRGRGRASQKQRFFCFSSSSSLNNNLTMGISKTIFSLVKSCRQTTGYFLWLVYVLSIRVRCDFSLSERKKKTVSISTPERLMRFRVWCN